MALSKNLEAGELGSSRTRRAGRNLPEREQARSSEFDGLMSRCKPRLSRMVRSILRDDTDVEDVMQQVYMRAYFKQSSYAGQASAETWLTRITINAALAHRRARRRWASCERIEGHADRLCGTGPTPEEGVAWRELSGLVGAALQALPAEYRLVATLREMEGMSSDETAQQLGVSAQLVRVRLFRARVLLRQYLSRQLGPQFTHEVLCRAQPARAQFTGESLALRGSKLESSELEAVGDFSTSRTRRDLGDRP
jgi:RNA polymerase sigma-70 factor, ECF subfamily